MSKKTFGEQDVVFPYLWRQVAAETIPRAYKGCQYICIVVVGQFGFGLPCRCECCIMLASIKMFVEHTMKLRGGCLSVGIVSTKAKVNAWWGNGQR